MIWLKVRASSQIGRTMLRGPSLRLQTELPTMQEKKMLVCLSLRTAVVSSGHLRRSRRHRKQRAVRLTSRGSRRQKNQR